MNPLHTTALLGWWVLSTSAACSGVPWEANRRSRRAIPARTNAFSYCMPPRSVSTIVFYP